MSFELPLILAILIAEGLIALLGLLVLWRLWNSPVGYLYHLLNEKDGSDKASLSRFQFLVFTFAVAASLLVLVVARVQAGELSFPPVDSGVWALLGISGGSYVISKGVQHSARQPADSDGDGEAGGGEAGGGGSSRS